MYLPWRRVSLVAVDDESRRVHVRSATYAARAQRAEAALDAIAAAALIVSGTGRLVHCNRAAVILLNREEGLLVRDRHLCATDPCVQEKLQGLIASAAAAGNGSRTTAGGVLGIPRPAGKYLLQLVVLPLHSARPPSHVLVLVGDPERTASLSAHSLTALYGLSLRKCELPTSFYSADRLPRLPPNGG